MIQKLTAKNDSSQKMTAVKWLSQMTGMIKLVLCCFNSHTSFFCSHGALLLGVVVLGREVICFLSRSVTWVFRVVYSEQYHTVQIEGGLWLWSNRKEMQCHNEYATQLSCQYFQKQKCYFPCNLTQTSNDPLKIWKRIIHGNIKITFTCFIVVLSVLKLHIHFVWC